MNKKPLCAVMLLTVALLLLLNRRPHPADTSSHGTSLSSTAAAATTTTTPAPPPEPRDSLLTRLGPETAAFHRWAAQYASAPPDTRAALLESGRPLARAHRARIKSLISTDPRRALEEALPVILRQELPPDITDLIEQRLNARGFYGVLGVASERNTGSPVRRTFQTPDGTIYEARVYGRRVRQHTTADAAVHGVALDGILALDEDPLRLMEPGERLLPAQPVFFNCPVSGKTVAAAATTAAAEVTPEAPAIELAGEVHFLCSGGHIHALREDAIAAEGGTGGPARPTGTVPSTWSTGVKSVLYIRVTFPEQWTDPQTEKDSYDMMKSVNDFFVENSHGALHLVTTVTPLLTMPRPASWYSANDTSGANAVLNDARLAARAAGFDYAAYDLDAVRYAGASGGFGGQAYVGSRGCWLKSSSVGVACHEFGHNLGLWHANSWSTGGESTIGSGTNSEYGNSFDTMGSANAGHYFFNAGHQNEIRWIPDENVTRIASSGIYRLFQFDQPRLDPEQHYLLVIPKDSQRDYWCEFRQKWTSNDWLMNGVQLNWSPWGDSASDNTPYGSNAGGQLLDATPGSLDGKTDSPVVLGRTFSDPGAGIHITPLSKGGTVPESVQVAVQIGAFPGNQPPSLQLSGGGVVAERDQPIPFAAVSSDPDGDALAWSWDWGDRTFGPNSPAADKSWSADGLYTVRCEVTDMRGGTRSALLPVTIGTTDQHRIAGRILTTDGAPVAGARVSCVQTGTSSTSQRLCLTDSEGNFLLSGLLDADYTLSAQHELFTLAPGFNNPVTLSGADGVAGYIATARPSVTISLPDNSCTENGDGAVLRFTRTAATNAGALSVRVFTGGSAGMNDLSFTPAETYDLTTWRFTLPDGAASLDVAVSAVNDTFAEGPETMTFYLVDGSGYIPSGVERVALLVNDDDTSLPVVSLDAVDASASEGGDGATLRLSRTGPLDTPLVVTLTRTGVAAAASDYTGINSTATIPAGAAGVDLALAAVQDNAAEGTEIATFSIGSSATWIRSPLAASANIRILDDDIPVLTVTAADAAAAETNSDPAVFIFTRTGDLAAALNVDYALGGTAQHGTDYWPLSGTLTIPAGLATAALVITPVDDFIGEPAQSVSVTLRSTSRYTIGEAFSASATITDNDVPHLSVSVSDGNCDESGGSGKFKIQSYGTGSGSTTVFYTLGGTATAGSDFAAVTGSISVPRSGFAEVAISPLQDSEFEDAESVVLTLVPHAAYTLAPENSAMLMLEDNDQSGVSVAVNASSYFENGSTVRFYFTRRGPTANALTVSYALSGAATAGEDYMAPPGAITIPAGATGAALDILLLDDTLAEGTESLTCSVTGTTGAYGIRIASATTWITDSEALSLPSVGFASGTTTVNENTGTVQITVSMAVAPTREVQVDYALDGGLAFNGVDCQAAGNGTLIFAPGEMTHHIEVTILDDSFMEPVESLTLRLVRASAARLGNSAHTVTINDNDSLPAPVAGFATPASTAGEGGGTAPGALVFLSAPQTMALSVAWAVTGGTATAEDAASAGGTLIFQPGETAKPIPLQIADDSLREPAETFILTLSAPAAPLTLAPQITHTLTVSDNDDTTVTIVPTDASAAEKDSEPAIFTVTRNLANTAQPLTVLLNIAGTAAPGDDYQALPAELVIPANAMTAVLTVIPVDDTLLDPAETVNVSVAPSSFYSVGAQSSGSITITDDETGIAVTATDTSAAEPAEPAMFTVTRSGPAAGELTVALTSGGTAAGGDDFVPLPQTVVFTAGQTTLGIPVVPLDDDLAEPDETITLTAQPGAGYIVSTGTVQVTLRDDDRNFAPIVTIQSPAAPGIFIPSGPGLVLNATVTDDGRPQPSAPVAVNWSVISGPGSVSFGNAGATDTTAQFSAPGQYLLRLTASDSELSESANLSVFVLSNTLAGANIGHSSTLTGIAGGGSAWTLTGVGATVGTATADSTFFAHRQMSGDFTIVARVASIGSSDASARCGVMVRGALTPGSKHAFASVAPTRTSFVHRPAENAAGVTSNTAFSTPLPRFVRLRRTGNTFTAAHSVDGINWTTQGSQQTVVMPDPVFAGLCATSASTTAAAVATFDSFSLTPAENTGPFVDAGPPQTSGFHTTLNGTVTDDNTPAVHWERRDGPGSLTLPDTATGTALFTSPGTHLLRLFASDGEIETFSDTSVQVTSPFSEWLTTHFGENAGDPVIAGPRADPDFDGLENLAEYALDSDPLLANTSALPASTRTETNLIITWRESTLATDMAIQPQWSDDLTEWSNAGLNVETIATGQGWKEQRAMLDISSRPRAALRLQITLP